MSPFVANTFHTAEGAHGEMQISHLCHNKKCFNPHHLVVEEPKFNNVCLICFLPFLKLAYISMHLLKARNSCVGLVKLWNGGKIYNPCKHGKHGEARRCVIAWAEDNRPPQKMVDFFLDNVDQEEMAMEEEHAEEMSEGSDEETTEGSDD